MTIDLRCRSQAGGISTCRSGRGPYNRIGVVCALATHLRARVSSDQHSAAGGLHTAQRDLHAVDFVVVGTLDDRERTAALGAHHHVAHTSHRKAIQVGTGDAVQHDTTVVGGIAYADEFSAHVSFRIFVVIFGCNALVVPSQPRFFLLRLWINQLNKTADLAVASDIQTAFNGEDVVGEQGVEDLDNGLLLEDAGVAVEGG